MVQMRRPKEKQKQDDNEGKVQKKKIRLGVNERSASE
jgi:hypothetical protein